MRNRITHGYDRVDFKEVWKVTQNDLRPMIRELEKYFLQLEQERQQQTQKIQQAQQLSIRPPRPRESRGPRMGM